MGLRDAGLSFIALPAVSLSAGEIRLTQGNFANQDFADRAMRLRCCNQREAWHMLTMPAVAMAGALSQLCSPLRLSEHQALDLSWYQLAKPQIWLWLLLDEIEALTPSIASVMNGGRSEVRDGSFIMASLMGKRHGPPTRNTTLPNSPLLHLGALLPVQHLLDEPERFPNLSVVGVTPLAMEHGPVLEVRVSASFPGSFLCPVQEAVGARLIQAFEQGRVMLTSGHICLGVILPGCGCYSTFWLVAQRPGTPSSPDRDGQWL